MHPELGASRATVRLAETTASSSNRSRGAATTASTTAPIAAEEDGEALQNSGIWQLLPRASTLGGLLETAPEPADETANEATDEHTESFTGRASRLLQAYIFGQAEAFYSNEESAAEETTAAVDARNETPTEVSETTSDSKGAQEKKDTAFQTPAMEAADFLFMNPVSGSDVLVMPSSAPREEQSGRDAEPIQKVAEEKGLAAGSTDCEEEQVDDLSTEVTRLTAKGGDLMADAATAAVHVTFEGFVRAQPVVSEVWRLASGCADTGQFNGPLLPEGEPLFPTPGSASRQPPKRVAIVYFDTGGGHRSAAQSLEAALKRLYGRQVHVRNVEVADFLPAPWCYASSIYSWLGQHPTVYGRMWKADSEETDFRKTRMYSLETISILVRC
eukprot:TRINITY_DN25220_c0_g1_i3.p1 TRINITY_DN25220_c0_g1~~TRINITY_DN25220_c0_g1_i3.p1  ORF type:complete len:387 (+),score=91.65 TRINITY_DN25220_c0_g1_i3:142-1302(+)